MPRCSSGAVGWAAIGLRPHSRHSWLINSYRHHLICLVVTVTCPAHIGHFVVRGFFSDAQATFDAVLGDTGFMKFRFAQNPYWPTPEPGIWLSQ